MNLAHLLLRSARWLPEQPAIAVGSKAVRSYADMAARVSRLAHSLRRKFSLAAGDRVALAMKNCPEYYELLFACWHAGLVAVPMNAKLHPREFAYILQNSGAKLCFVTPDLESAVPHGISVASADFRKMFSEEAMQAPPRWRPMLPAWLFYTSGTTGVPKGAVLTHRNLLFATQAYFADIDKLAPGDSILHAAPLSHGSGLYGLPHFAAGALNVIPESGHFEPDEIYALLDHWRNVSFFAAPTMIVRLLASPAARAPANLKTISYGGAPMYVADSLRAIELFGPRLYQLYGQGESPMTITGLTQAMHAERRALESCGIARTGVEVAVFDADDAPLPPGGTGEIVTRRDCVMAGYWQQPRGERARPARRLAAHRRRRQPRRRGFPHPQGPLQGHDHLGRQQHLSARDRGGAAAPPRGGRVLGGRPPASRVGRRGGGLRRLPPGDHAAGARCALPRAHRALQAPARIPLRARAAEEQLRQGAQDRAAPPGRGYGTVACHGTGAQ